jgi:hypothetical protein
LISVGSTEYISAILARHFQPKDTYQELENWLARSYEQSNMVIAW